MIDYISWEFAIPAFIILCLIGLVIWLIQDRNDIVRAIDDYIAFTERDLSKATDVEDVAYYEGTIEGLNHAKLVILEGKGFEDVAS